MSAKIVKQPCRLVLPSGAIAEITIRVPAEAANEVKWEFTSESVLVMVRDAARPSMSPPQVRTIGGGAPAQEGGIVTPFHSSSTISEAEIEAEAEAERERAIEESRRRAAARGEQIAKQAASLRRISVEVAGEHVEEQLSASGGT